MNWTFWVFVIGSFSCKYVNAQVQRVPPGVSPQHYQQVCFLLKIINHMVAIIFGHDVKFFNLFVIIIKEYENDTLKIHGIHNFYDSFIHSLICIHFFLACSTSTSANATTSSTTTGSSTML